jgi:hypothetical protein
MTDKQGMTTTGKILFWLAALAFFAGFGALYFAIGTEHAHALVELFFFGVIGLLLYFIPSLNACGRKHKNRAAIYALNFVAGWTFVGWVVAMVWSCTKDVEGATP